MKVLRDSGHRCLGVMFVCLCVALPALWPEAVQASPLPMISAKLAGHPAHIHLTGKNFTPGSPILVTFDYFPMKKRIVQIAVASSTGSIVINQAVLSLSCGVETIRMIASNPSTHADSKAVRVYFHRGACP